MFCLAHVGSTDDAVYAPIRRPAPHQIGVLANKYEYANKWPYVRKHFYLFFFKKMSKPSENRYAIIICCVE